MMTTLYWIADLKTGRLAVMPRPRGGDWLEDEVRAWRAAGIDLIVSLLEDEEVRELDLVGEPELCGAAGIGFLRLSIPDRSVPASVRTVENLVADLEVFLARGNAVAIHCRQGVGRSALLAACLLAASGVQAAEAFRRIEAARGCPVPDTAEQREWVNRFAGTLSRET
jgi:protein-tyrosine phosphatase